MLLNLKYNDSIFPVKPHLQDILQWGFTLCMTLCLHSLKAQTSFDLLAQHSNTRPKFIVMNISSTSCVYCLMQEKKIKKDSILKSRLDSAVYYLPWTIEKTANFVFDGQEFSSGTVFIDTYGKDNKGFVAYPLWLIFNKDYKLIYRYTGMLPTKKINELLNVLEGEK